MVYAVDEAPADRRKRMNSLNHFLESIGVWRIMKICSTCKIEKPATTEFFSRSSNRKGGLHYKCKECRKVSDKTQHAKALQKARDARRYEKNKVKPLARDAARKKWGKASDWRCGVMECGEQAKELHHIDYQRPLDVIPLCKTHHDILHMNDKI